MEGPFLADPLLPVAVAVPPAELPPVEPFTLSSLQLGSSNHSPATAVAPTTPSREGPLDVRFPRSARISTPRNTRPRPKRNRRPSHNRKPSRKCGPNRSGSPLLSRNPRLSRNPKRRLRETVAATTPLPPALAYR